ncbi:tyrosine-protein phosphatase YwqE [Pedobacter sp. AK013]|uniref:tyrosine-protein phosphatase n=1 Tax=Pedobacter sp. AK013 TaxID=2723071 RepID=UPI00161D2D21|nr:CpsB/CapC family capsule biosynthesis tyrosine phosphatase [Pedobacter sp. AK013]MBB6240100.1 tyrosine-protein phosphatase YwqE [Pedobacter sp. AK013]
MLSFFSKKNKVTDISWLGVDMHSHVLPGIDDGSPDVATSLRFVKSLQELGFEQLICTPHIYKELYPNTKETIFKAKSSLQSEMNKAGIALKLAAGAEYMIDQDFNLEESLCPLDQKHLLIEMSYLSESPGISKTIFEIEIKGYQPVLAHPERYTFYFKDKSRLRRFKEKGCLLQLNLLSVLGYYGREVKQLAELLLKEKMYDFAGTDLHHDKHLSTLTEAVQTGKLYDLIGSYGFKNQEVFGSICV